MIDSHCHFDFAAFTGQQAAIWQQCRARGIRNLIIPAVEPALIPLAVELSEQLQGVYFAAGLHPWWVGEFAQQHGENCVESLRTIIRQYSQHPRCVAVGECGLDAAIETPVAEQLPLFQAQLALAGELELPVIIHSRKAHAHILQQLKQFPEVRGVIHAFSGSREQGEAFIQQGFCLGIGGTITYPRAQKTRNAVASLPLDALLLETDAPDMPLAGRQGEANSPLYLPDVATTLAQLRNQPVADIQQQTTRNCYHLFKRLTDADT